MSSHFYFLFWDYLLPASNNLVFWNSIHLEVASDSFCFLLYSSWLLVFILYVFELFFSFINLYCWKGLHFSQNNFLIFIFIIVGLIFSFHFWFRDLLRELDKKYEVLLIFIFLLFLKSHIKEFPKDLRSDLRYDFIKTTYDITLDSH